MKCLKICSILAVAALLLTPATAMAKSHFSFSLNLVDFMRPPRPMLPPPPPVYVAPVPPGYYFYPCPPRPIYQQRTIVKEYHYYHQAPEQAVEEITPHHPYYRNHPHR